MRLYLSSFRLGTDPQQLVRLAGLGARIAVIANAIDDEPADVRRQKTADECSALRRLGLQPRELDLRQHFGGHADDAHEALTEFEALWVRGGNVFVLRRALAESSFDTAICDLLSEDALVYAGYSAGPCVLAPSLDGLDEVDDITGPERAYGLPPLIRGLNVLDRPVLPHVDPIELTEESSALDRLALRFEAGGIAYLPLRDGQALVVDGALSEIVGQPVAAADLLYDRH